MKLATTQPVCVNATSLLTQASSSSKSDDETKSTCDSFKSPRVEYIDNEDVSAVVSIERKAFSSLYITPSSETTNGLFSTLIISFFFFGFFLNLLLACS